MKIKIYNIAWDPDPDQDQDELPEKEETEIDAHEAEEHEIAEMLEDRYGTYVLGFDFDCADEEV